MGDTLKNPRGFLAGAGVLFLLMGCSAQPGHRPGLDDEADIRSLVATYDSAWLAKDAATVERILSPAYVYFTSNGELSSRAATLEFLQDTSYHLSRSQRTETVVTLEGPVARISSRWEGTGRFRGEPVLDDQTCGQTWVRGDSGWRLLTEHCANRSRP